MNDLSKGIEKGDTIGLISASGATPPDRLQPAIASIEKLGLKVVVGETCHARHGYLAGTDDQRAADVHRMFQDPTIDGIFVFAVAMGLRKFYRF